MVAERLQAPNYWPSFISPQNPGTSLPRKQFWKIHFILFALRYPFSAPPVTDKRTLLTSCTSVPQQSQELLDEAGHLLQRTQKPCGSQYCWFQVTTGPKSCSEAMVRDIGSSCPQATLSILPCSPSHALLWLLDQGRYHSTAPVTLSVDHPSFNKLQLKKLPLLTPANSSWLPHN